MTCFIKHCKNIRRLLPPDSNISFHRFPTDENIFSTWLNVIGMADQNIKWVTYRYICSDHFRPEDIMIVNGKRILKKSAIPTLNIKDTFACTQKNIARIDQITEQPSTSSSVATFLHPSVATTSPRRTKRSVDNESGSESSPSSGKSPTLQTVKVTESSSGSDSSSSRKRKRCKLEHSYACSPGRSKKRSEEIKQKFIQQSVKLYRTRQSVKRLKKKVNSLKMVLNDLKLKNVLSTSALEHLEKSFSDMPAAIMNRMLKNVRSGTLSKSQYPEQLRKFAVTLHFYSSKAYNYVRNTFHLALPHPSTIRKWCSTVECVPGFSEICFTVLKTKVAEAARLKQKVICSLLLDEMSIKKQIDFDGERYWGYVDIGIDFQNDEVEAAQEALVLMVVCLNASWKLPIGYFLIKSLTGAEKSNIVREALVRLDSINVDITSITSDGPAAHFSMFKELGCNFSDVNNLKTYFEHPSNKSIKIHSVFDMCHMLKLLRNALAVLKVIVDPEGNEIKWEFISKLHDIQETETLLLANKLKKSHMEWRKQKMKVNIAAQTLSNSVAEALLFLTDDLKHPKFEGCKPTVNFIKIVDRVFDLLNSRLPWARGYKGPLRVNNEEIWRPMMKLAVKYFLNLKDVNGRFLWQTPRKTPFLGCAISLLSIMGIFDNFVKTDDLKYLLTYKMSQDHLELFFCSVRSRNGWNNNPSALQFMRTYRKLLMHADVSGSGGNCQVLDATSVLSVTSAGVSNKDLILQNVDIHEVRKHSQNYNDYIHSMHDHNYDVLPKLIGLSEFSEYVVTYIAGYVIKMLERMLHCDTCLSLLIEENPEDQSYLLIKRRNLGAYLYPSKSLIKICSEAEIFIRKLMNLNDNVLPSPSLVSDIVINVSAKLLHNLSRTIYPNHEHNFELLKKTIYCYCKIRLHNLSKKYSTILQGDAVRKKFNKLILFYHQ